MLGCSAIRWPETLGAKTRRCLAALACLLLTLGASCSQTSPAIRWPTASPLPPATVTPLPPSPPPPTASPSFTPTSPPPTPAPANKAGIHLLLDDGRNAWPQSRWAEHLTYASRLVGEWGYVTELVRLDDLDPAKWQYFFDLCADLRLIPILRLATTFDRDQGYWIAPPPDQDGSYAGTAAAYAAFVAALDWPHPLHYVIAGNEPNHGDEWGGRAAPAEYARFLVETAAALRQADPAVQVVNAPLDLYAPNTNGQPFANGMTYLDALTFLEAMLAAEPGLLDSIDVWGSHPYPQGPFTHGPWEQAYHFDLLNGAAHPPSPPAPAGVFNRGINGYAWELFKLAEHGAHGLPVMITETGWRHAESTDPLSKDGAGEYPPAAAVAAFFDLALRGNLGAYPQWPAGGWLAWEADPRVLAVTPFALNGHPAEWGHSNWLALAPDGAVLGVYPMFEVWGR
jgi:hypothetical protein